MSKQLKENITSAYIKAGNQLKSTHTRQRIVAYVESYDDIYFWRTVLSDFETDKLYFQIMLPSHCQHLERGKKAVLMNLLTNKVGSNMIACVDADYDYLIQGATATSKEIISNPYVFHTYAYAIENLQCYAPALFETCVMVTLNDHHIFDMQQYIEDYSRAIYPLFIWNIWFYRSPNYKLFTMNDFLKIIDPGHFSMNRASDIIAKVQTKVNKRIAQFHCEYPTAKEEYLKLKANLRQLGVTPETAYLYIQGHHLFDKVVVPVLNKVCVQLIQERECEIARQSIHATQQRNELTSYHNSIADITAMLKKNTTYKKSEPFLHICEDVKKYMESYFH